MADPSTYDPSRRHDSQTVIPGIPELDYFRSEIDDDVVARLRAAGQHIAVRPAHLSGLVRRPPSPPGARSRTGGRHQSGKTIARNVARLGKLKQALPPPP